MQVDESLLIKAYYAGHVLGAAMFHVRVGHQSMVYTVCEHEYCLFMYFDFPYYYRVTIT